MTNAAVPREEFKLNLFRVQGKLCKQCIVPFLGKSETEDSF